MDGRGFIAVALGGCADLQGGSSADPRLRRTATRSSVGHEWLPSFGRGGRTTPSGCASGRWWARIRRLEARRSALAGGRVSISALAQMDSLEGPFESGHSPSKLCGRMVTMWWPMSAL